MTRFSFDGKLETMGDEIRPSLAVVIHVEYSFFLSTLLSYTLLIFCKCHHHHHHIYSPFCKWFNKHIITNRGGRLSQKPSGSLDRPPIVYYTIIYYLCYQKNRYTKKNTKNTKNQNKSSVMRNLWLPYVSGKIKIWHLLTLPLDVATHAAITRTRVLFFP